MPDTFFFIFLQKKKILVRYRKTDGRVATCALLEGHILAGDKEQSLDGLENAFHREIYEQFKGTVIPLRYERVEVQGENDLSQTVFFVFSWDGELPDYLVEGKEKIARLRFVLVDEALEEIVSPPAREVLGRVKEAIRINNLLQRKLHF